MNFKGSVYKYGKKDCLLVSRLHESPLNVVFAGKIGDKRRVLKLYEKCMFADQKEVEKFEGELEFLFGLFEGSSVPRNLVRCYGGLCTNKLVGSVHEFCGKGTLLEYVDSHCFSPGLKLYFLYEIVKGVCFLHSKGIVHGSLFDHIYVGDDFLPKIGSNFVNLRVFGKTIDADGGRKDKELKFYDVQKNGAVRTCEKSDLYSLSWVIYCVFCETKERNNKRLEHLQNEEPYSQPLAWVWEMMRQNWRDDVKERMTSKDVLKCWNKNFPKTYRKIKHLPAATKAHLKNINRNSIAGLGNLETELARQLMEFDQQQKEKEEQNE